MKKGWFVVLPKSKPILGFNDTGIMVAGCTINTVIMMSLLYKDMLFTGPHDIYAGLFIGIFVFMTIHWYLMRLFYLKIVSLYPGYSNRFKRMVRLPLVLGVYFLVTIILDFLLDPILAINEPGHQKPPVSIELISGTVLAIIDIGMYESIHVFVELKNTKIEQVKLEKEKATASLVDLKNQMNPDFLFKNLKRLEMLIDKDSNKAKDFLFQLSKVYKTILQVSEKKVIPIRDELKYTHEFINLLNEHSENQIHLKFNTNHGSRKKIAPLSLHLIFEDILRHNDDKNEDVYIEITESENHLEIKNNLKEKQVHLLNNSMALNQLKSRYLLLTQKEIEFINKDSSFVLKLPLLS